MKALKERCMIAVGEAHRNVCINTKFNAKNV
jgi:hypothetical protein